MADTLEGFPDFFRYAVWQLLQTCGGGVGSGSRTSEEQTSLYASKGPWSPTNAGAAAPGTSNHEVNVGYGAADMEGDLDCMHANAERFGLHFPISNEPWHIEPTDELIDAGMAFFGDVPQGVDPNAASTSEDPMDRIARLLMGEEEADGSMPGQPTGVQPAAAATAAPGQQAEFTPTASAGYTSGDQPPVSPAEAAEVLARAGFRGEALVIAVAVAMGESGFDPDIHGDTSLTDSTWGPSIGLMQIRSVNAESGQGTWRDGTRLEDPLFNAKAAFAISGGGTNFQPWTIFTNGAYLGNMDEARAAVAQIGVMGPTPPATPETPNEAGELDDLLSAPDPNAAMESAPVGDIMTDPVGDEVDTSLKQERYASA